MTKEENIQTRIWNEVAEPDNPFATQSCHLSGFDVYGDLLGKITYIQFLYLLFKLEPASENQALLLETLAISLANPGPRDHSIRAAMSGGAGGSGSAACLMAALGIGAGSLCGGREVFITMQGWERCGFDLEKWRSYLTDPHLDEQTDVWPKMEHPPGFDPYGVSCATPVKQSLDTLIACNSGTCLPWLKQNRQALEKLADRPLAMSGVAATALHDLALTPEQGEMLYLLLRLPGAAVHALEQQTTGFKKYPFCADRLDLLDDPGEQS